jgi:hypothetical protein
VDHFQSAVSLDPDNVNARLFLATALTQIIRSQPMGVTAPNGGGPWTPVLRQYEEVLARDHTNQGAILGLATLGGPAPWQQTHTRLAGLIAADPQNRGAYYATGVMDWQLAFQPIRQAFGTGGMQMVGLVPDPALRRSLRDKYQSTIDEGVRMMQTVLQLSPGSPDALAYLNLLHREAACLADTDEQSKELTAKADVFVKQALDAQQARSAVPSDSSPERRGTAARGDGDESAAASTTSASTRLSTRQPVEAVVISSGRW